MGPTFKTCASHYLYTQLLRGSALSELTHSRTGPQHTRWTWSLWRCSAACTHMSRGVGRINNAAVRSAARPSRCRLTARLAMAHVRWTEHSESSRWHHLNLHVNEHESPCRVETIV